MQFNKSTQRKKQKLLPVKDADRLLFRLNIL